MTICHRYWLILVFIGLIPSSALLGQSKKGLVTILEGSKISLDGTTNVNSYHCSLERELHRKQVSVIYELAAHEIRFLNADLKMRVKNFECENKIMTQDMHTALKESKHPFMDIDLGVISFKDHKIAAVITVAGVSKNYTLSYQLLEQRAGYFHVRVQKEMNMLDFKIDPPKALFGMVRVNEQITINIELKFEIDY
jgi:hypothetical protein